ncbi:hypothetical protein [Oleidesulfovibrio sp.]|uniref:hypothetical protein n=1 Tax=Oleidesulfovibrio sp. TaxID=2909707 RepID=UPI003A8905C9
MSSIPLSPACNDKKCKTTTVPADTRKQTEITGNSLSARHSAQKKPLHHVMQRLYRQYKPAG